MWLPAIKPLCDKDNTPMSLREILPDSGAADFVTAYACNSEYCDRCYNGDAGSFDLANERPKPDHRQTLCEADALPMFLEIVEADQAEIWRCPGCNCVTVRREQDAG